METRSTYIELGRSFVGVDQRQTNDVIKYDGYTHDYPFRSNYNWDELLKFPRVVVLGEAGSGKTFELRERAQILRQQDKFAFFIRLDQLITSSLLERLLPDELSLFNKWAESGAECFFFLDSVDESKFDKITDFYSALTSFRKALPDNLLNRAMIFLSSRISEWKPYNDSKNFSEILPHYKTSSDIQVSSNNAKGSIGQLRLTSSHIKITPPSSEILVVSIRPLNINQVRQFAKNSDVKNPEFLLKAIEDAQAWEFAHRPLDVTDIIRFWNANNHIGSLTELIKFSINKKLDPRSESERNDHTLSNDKARDGAKWLAAATMFSRKFLLSIHEDATINSKGLKTDEWLSDGWTHDEARALLNRPLFDGALYGNVCFHHRRIAEFLAAEWLNDRVNNGMPPHHLFSLFSDKVANQLVFRRSFYPIIAWLCYGHEQWNTSLRNLLLETDPAIFFTYGDPSQLDIDFRRKILLQMENLAKKHAYLYLNSDAKCLSRIADLDLADEISRMLMDDKLSSDFRDALASMALLKQLKSCQIALKAIIFGESNPGRIKQHILMQLDKMNDRGFALNIYDQFLQGPILKKSICEACILSMFPKFLDPSQLMVLLEHSEPLDRNNSEHFFNISYYFQNLEKEHKNLALLRAFNDLMDRHLAQNPKREYGIYVDFLDPYFEWIKELVEIVLSSVLDNNVLTLDVCYEAGRSLCMINFSGESRYYGSKEVTSHLHIQINKHLSVRQSWFGQLLPRLTKNSIKMEDAYYAWHDFFRFGLKDMSWIIRDAENSQNKAFRREALSFALSLWMWNGTPVWRFPSIYFALSGNKDLRYMACKNLLLSPYAIVVRKWYRIKHKPYAHLYWWRHRWEKLHAVYPQIKFWLRTNLKASKIRSGEQSDLLFSLLNEVWGTNSNLAITNWEQLQKRFGKRITRVTQEGCKAIWRKESPPPKEHGNISWISIAGLTGIQLEFDQNDDFENTLSEADVTLASLYAIEDLNSLPNWFTKLVKSHPLSTMKVLTTAIEEDWRRGGRFIVQKILSLELDNCIDPICEKLLQLLEETDPFHEHEMVNAISILMKNEQTYISSRLCAIAQAKLNHSGYKVEWMALYLKLDGHPALLLLEVFLSKSENPTDLMAALCDSLYGERYTAQDNFCLDTGYRQISCLAKFIPLIFKYVKPSDDIIRSGGGSYTPIPRDDAQRFRDSLLADLATNKNPEALTLLVQLQDNPTFEKCYDWISDLINKSRMNQIELSPWTAKDLKDFAKKYDIDPKTDLELFSLVNNHLLSIKWAVEQSDNSLRNEVHENYDENDLRSWLQRKLLVLANDRYSAPQEVEIDLKERPDILIEHPKINPVSIEIKLAERWTLQELVERLENQLIGQYLRAYNSRCGFFFLGYIDKNRKQHWEDPITKANLTFVQVIERLEVKALELLQKNAKVDRLEVVSINFVNPKARP